MRGHLRALVYGATVVLGGGTAWADYPQSPAPVAVQTVSVPEDVLRLAQLGCPNTVPQTQEPDRPSSAKPKPHCIDPAKIGGARETDETKAAYILFSEDNFASPIYQTLRGQLLSETMLRVFSYADDIIDATGAKTGATSRHRTEAEQFERYGITDSLSFAADATDNLSTQSKTVQNSVVTEKSHAGWSSLQLDVIYRMMEQPEEPIYFDILPQYTTHFDTPNRTVSFEEKIGHVFDAVTVQGSIQANYNWQVGYGRHSSGIDGNLVAEAFGSLGGAWSAKGVLEYDIVRHANGSAEVEAELAYDLVPEKLQLELDYGHDFNSVGGTRNNRVDFVALRLGYLFDFQRTR